jgi:hypothetical protein
MTTETAFFVPLPSLTIGADSTFGLSVPADAMVTVSTVSSAAKGTFPSSPIPAAAPWPLPYADDFSSYTYDAMAKYFSDQGGSWAVRNGSLTQVSGGNPDANGWAPNPDPLSQMGDETWQDYAVSATFVFSPPTPAVAMRPTPSTRSRVVSPRLRAWRLARGLPEEEEEEEVGQSAVTGTVFAVPCDATDPAQAFSSNASTGWLAGAWGGVGCLTTCGCDPTCVQMFNCGVEGCGAPGQSYEWTFGAGGVLTNAAYPGAGLTANEVSGGLSVKNLTGAADQSWAFQPAGDSGVGLVAGAAGLCLSQAAPVHVYIMLCGRITSYNGFSATSTPGYCLSLYASGEWDLAINSVPQVSGNASAPFSPSAPHRLTVSMAGPVIDAFLDGTHVASVTDTAYGVGNAAVGSGWHSASVSDFTVTTPL